MTAPGKDAQDHRPTGFIRQALRGLKALVQQAMRPRQAPGEDQVPDYYLKIYEIPGPAIIEPEPIMVLHIDDPRKQAK